MPLRSPRTIANALKKSRKRYQLKAVDPRHPAEKVHFQITLGLKRLTVIARKEATGAGAEQGFQESKHGTLQNMQKYQHYLKSNRHIDPNKDRLPGFLRTFGKLTLAVSELEYQTLETQEVEDFDADSLPELTPDQEACIEKPIVGDAMREARENTRPRPAAVPQDPALRKEDPAEKFRRLYDTLVADVTLKWRAFPADSAKARQWWAVIKGAADAANKGKWEHAALALRQVLGAMNAELAAQTARVKGREELTEEQLDTLKKIDEDIALRARENYADEAKLDGALETNDKPRPVPVLKPGLGPTELKALKAAVTAGAKGKDALGRAAAISQDFVQKRLAAMPPESDEVFDLSLKSEADLKGDAAVALGLVTPATVEACKCAAEEEYAPTYGRVTDIQLQWFARLSSKQQALVGAMARGMLQAVNASSPNKLEQDYEYVEDRGAGGYGKVSRYRKKGTNENVAVKSLRDDAKRLEMERELRVHRQAMGGAGGTGHRNLVPLKGVARGSDGSLHMVMEEAKGGDLKKMTDCLGYAVGDGALPPAAAQVLAQQFVRDAVAGLKFVQEQNVTHHDIKASNFLLSEDGTVMIADLGSGQIGRDAQGTVPGTAAASHPIHTTQKLEAPELFGKTASGKSDTYTLGIVIDKLMNGPRPRYDTDTYSQLFTAPPASLAVDRLTRAMLDRDPQKRPTLEAVEHSSFLQDAAGHDPAQVAQLKAASMQYARVANRALRGTITKEWFVAQDGMAQVYFNARTPSHFGEVLEWMQERVTQLGNQIRDREKALTELPARQQPERDRLRRQIEFYGGLPSTAAQKAEAEKELRELDEQLAQEQKEIATAIQTARDQLAKVAKDQEAMQTAVFGELRKDPEFQQTEAQLKAAAAPFSSVTEDNLDALPGLMRRWHAVAQKLGPIRDRVEGTVAHVRITARLKGFLDAHDRKDVRECRRLIRELEDYYARVLGSQERQGKVRIHEGLLRNLQEARDQLEAQKQKERDQLMEQLMLQDDPRAAPQRTAIEQELRRLDPKYAELLQELDAKHQPAIDKAAAEIEEVLHSLK
jgi:hypothetical protein